MALENLITTITTLRGDQGCPWDKKQTCNSLIQYLRSECEELVAAITNNDSSNICEELGDILYLVLMMTEINKDNGLFTLDDVITKIDAKLIRRHPHVFAGIPYESEEQLKRQWQQIKADEKKSKIV